MTSTTAGYIIITYRIECPRKGVLKNQKMKFIYKIPEFLKEVRIEMKKVTWLSRQETFKYTMIVVGVSIGVALFLGLWDFIFSTLLKKFIL